MLQSPVYLPSKVCVFVASVTIQAIDCFLVSETILQSALLFFLVVRYFGVLILSNLVYRPDAKTREWLTQPL